MLIKEGIALRGTFIIDTQGVIRQKSINDLPIGRSIDETLRLLKALQFNEKFGEGNSAMELKCCVRGLIRCCFSVCPANWDPEKNADTIKPDVSGSKEYFNKH